MLSLVTLEINNIEFLPHPAPPDLNFIEYLWDNIGRRLRNLEKSAVNFQKLERALNKIWHKYLKIHLKTSINT